MRGVLSGGRCLAGMLIIAWAASCLVAQTPAFPGAEGFGRFATGGRGGDVYVVTNLNDSGVGSLRAGVTGRTSASAPRTVVFAVSGTIYLQSTLRITQGNLTIAGQTAPGDGICLAYRPLDISNSTNVIIRFLRVRLGDVAGVETDAFTSRYGSDIIIDHCSFSWSVDETSSTYDNTNLTQQWCFITESMRDSVHSKGAHGYGGIWGGKGASYHHNLIAHHDSRNPRFNGARTHGTADELVDMRNNVIYNWRGNSTYGGEPTDTGVPARHNMVANIYKNGPATSTGTSRYRILEPTANGASTGALYSLFHISGNWTTASTTVSADNWNGGVQVIAASLLPSIQSNTAFDVPPVTTQTAQEAYPLVLAYAGCRLPTRDVIDIRIAGEVAAGTATYRGSKGNIAGIIDSQADVGGWPILATSPAPIDSDTDGMPDTWELARGLNPNLASDRNLVDSTTGYTRLELYLNELAAPSFPRPVIESQPLSVEVFAGAPASLNVTATGPGPMAYQWFRDGIARAGATNATLSFSAMTTSDAGTYTVVVSNAYGEVRSSEVELVVSQAAPVISTPLLAITRSAGEPAEFSVVAVGSAPLMYQWLKNGVPLPGETAATLTISSVAPSDAADYAVQVSNTHGSVLSDAVSLTVLAQVTRRIFTTDFSNDTLHASSPTLTTTATNWYVMANKLATRSVVGDDSATSGVVESGLVLALNAGSSAANYQTAAVFSPEPVSLASIGSSLRVTATFTTANNINLGFGLFNSGGVLPHTTHHSGASANLLGGTEGIDGGVRHWIGYRALLTHGSTAAAFFTRVQQTTSEGSITNRTQDLVVPGSGTASYGQPAGVSIGSLVNASASFTPANDAVYTLVFEIERTAADELTLAYRLHTGGGTTGEAIFAASGVTTAAAARPSAVTSSFDAFAIGARTTNGALPRILLTALSVDRVSPAVHLAPFFSLQPSGLVATKGEAFSLTAAASGSPEPTYQWYRDGVPIPGAVSATLRVVSSADFDTGVYHVVASNTAGSTPSHSATVVVRSLFETWVAGHGLDLETTGLPDADPDGDNVGNAIEFLLGGVPVSAAHAPRPMFTIAGDGAGLAEFSYARRRDFADHFTLETQVSADLVNWVSIPVVGDGVIVEVVQVDDVMERITVKVPLGAPRLFVRLRATPL